jgi:uncharacterized protein YecE (DUF72 family)
MAARRRGRLRVGTSGYQYDHWRGLFYPAGLAKKRWFAHYAGHFDTVEINNTFYRLPAAATFDAWREAAPKGFCYALKFSRWGTHLKRLTDAKATIDLFLERAERLGNSLGPILVQLPPRWRANPERLDEFLAHAPKRHRWAVEFRDPSWLCAEVYAVLRRRRAALCFHDRLADHPRAVTADWVYQRFHGVEYGGDYGRRTLRAEAEQMRGWLADGLDVYAYFNNDVGGFAVPNARDLRRLVLRSNGGE